MLNGRLSPMTIILMITLSVRETESVSWVPLIQKLNLCPHLGSQRSAQFHILYLVGSRA
jgi:hypothetical protein